MQNKSSVQAIPLNKDFMQLALMPVTTSNLYQILCNHIVQGKVSEVTLGTS